MSKSNQTEKAALVELRTFAIDTTAAAIKAKAASVHLVRAAIIGKDHFSDTVEAFYGEIRTDANGIAKKVRAERNKDGDAFVVPGNIRAQVSQILRAVKFGVDLGTMESPKGAGEIRTATSKAAEAAEKATAETVPLTGDDAIRAAVIAALQEAMGIIKSAEGEMLAMLALATKNYSEAVTGIVARSDAEKPDDGKAAAMAKAA